jgi:5-oxoprolinase (ATP-hydrolysing) subunit A
MVMQRRKSNMFKIDLNSDLGESFGAYTIGRDDAVIPLITSANIACGFHAADPVVMAETVACARDSGTAIGAHPGFPDLMGFGRREMSITPAEAKAYCMYQIGALAAFAHEAGMSLQHVKPHGALYNMAGKNYQLARGICEGIAAVNTSLIVLGIAGSQLLKAASDCGLRTAGEIFADRAYEEDGSLVSRKKEGAMIVDEAYAVQRVVRMIKEGVVTAITGKDIPVRADSVCVHGDSEYALAFITKLRAAFVLEHIECCPLTDIV